MDCGSKCVWMVGVACADPSEGQRLYEQARQTQDIEERIALLKASLKEHQHFEAFYALGLAYQEADSLDRAGGGNPRRDRHHA